MITLTIIPDTSPNYNYTLQCNPDTDNNSWWYLHGELEKQVNTDKGVMYGLSQLHPKFYRKSLAWTVKIGNTVQVKKFDKKKMSYLDGVFQVEVEGVKEECVGFFWVTGEAKCYAVSESSGRIREFNDWYQRGLVVKVSDTKGYEYALKKYMERSELL